QPRVDEGVRLCRQLTRNRKPALSLGLLTALQGSQTPDQRRHKQHTKGSGEQPCVAGAPASGVALLAFESDAGVEKRLLERIQLRPAAFVGRFGRPFGVRLVSSP